MSAVIWTNYVDMKKTLPGLDTALRDRWRPRREVTLLCGCGASGGWELPLAEPVMAEYIERGVRVYPRVAFLATYRGHSDESWYDPGVWREAADNLGRVLEIAKRLPTRGLAVDFEPYTEPATYPSHATVGRADSEVAMALRATRPVLDLLRGWRGRLLIAPGGLEYGIVPYLLAARPRSYWLDEWTFAGDDTSLGYAVLRKPQADAVAARFVPGLRFHALAPEHVRRWRAAGFHRLWFHIGANANIWDSGASRSVLMRVQQGKDTQT